MSATTNLTERGAIGLAKAVREGRLSARDLCARALARAEALGPECSGFTRLLQRRAMARADAVDAVVSNGGDPGPLAGVPFGVPDQFDIAGQVTHVGSRTRAHSPLASRDAKAIALLEAAGAILIGTQLMDEAGYGFVTMNEHFGTARNPYDETRLAGGAAGGSAVAVARDIVPFSLAFDFNGSLRVPAALCGVIGLKATFGDLPLDGVFPFAESLDVIGVLGRDIEDVALVREILRADRPQSEAAPDRPLRFGRLLSWFDQNIGAEARAPLEQMWSEVGRVGFDLEYAELARAAASIIIAAEGASLYRSALEADPMAFETPVRDRLLAGCLLPAEDYLRAQRTRNWIQQRARGQFAKSDVLFTLAAPGFAPLISDPVMDFADEKVPARSHLGIYTQPISLMGLPALVLPLAGEHAMPLGVQLIAAAGQEEILLKAARQLLDMGLCRVPDPAQD
ncbi:AtzE family amidohydrolase [Novosphingobium aquimarinum]|uniref:AtzE family amidohydrolase n=1 Tax=Novosphingobium aquimarinum TaxID=2682494 RepID=UPI0012EBEC15|nr:AtzE family amidohydrolase [Novosphingobium aquimarinum]